MVGVTSRGESTAPPMAAAAAAAAAANAVGDVGALIPNATVRPAAEFAPFVVIGIDELATELASAAVLDWSATALPEAKGPAAAWFS